MRRPHRANAPDDTLSLVQLPSCALVVLDLPLASLPDNELVPRIRQTARSEELGIVLLVAGYEELEAAAREFAGESMYVIGKPVPQPTLLAKVRLLVGAARRERALKQREEALARAEREALSALKSLAVRTRALTDNATLGLGLGLGLGLVLARGHDLVSWRRVEHRLRRDFVDAALHWRNELEPSWHDV